MKYLFIFNDSPYGDQRAYNGLRLAAALSRKAGVRVFLLGDGVLCGVSGFAAAHADYNPQELLRAISATGAAIAACGTRMEARGIPAEILIPEVRRSNMDELAAWTEECEKMISF
jgi:uncharacterized protein involved in oxidation of intracellular sulfur